MNPYAAPMAKVDAAASAPEPVFFAVSGLKLALMSVATLGLYEVYWFYKNWKCVQRNFGDKVGARLRAVFYPDPWWLAGFFGVMPLLPVQGAANAINRKQAPAADPNARFTGWNIFGLVAGGLVVILAIIGAFAPVPE